MHGYLFQPWTSELKAWKLQEGSRQIVLCSTSIFECWKLKAKHKKNCFGFSFNWLELENFKRGWSKFSCFSWALKETENYRISKPYTNSKHINKKEKTWKRNWKTLKTYVKLLCLCVLHLLQEQEHNNIYVKVSIKILVFLT
jgi:hypothetical protein